MARRKRKFPCRTTFFRRCIICLCYWGGLSNSWGHGFLPSTSAHCTCTLSHAPSRAWSPTAEQGRRGSVLTERWRGPETRVSYQKHIQDDLSVSGSHLEGTWTRLVQILADTEGGISQADRTGSDSQHEDLAARQARTGFNLKPLFFLIALLPFCSWPRLTLFTFHQKILSPHCLFSPAGCLEGENIWARRIKPFYTKRAHSTLMAGRPWQPSLLSQAAVPSTGTRI